MLVLVVAQDRGEVLDEVGPILAGGAADELGAEDLGAPLQQPAEQRQVLPLRHAVVASLPEIVQRQVVERLEERRVAG